MAEDYLRSMSDSELAAVVEELEERAEEFDAKIRMQINDELRRRKMHLVGMVGQVGRRGRRRP